MRERTRPPTHPGGILRRHYLEPLNLTVSEVAQGLNISRKTLHKILSGRGMVTTDMALRLSQAFRTTPELWLNLQRSFDLWHASHESHVWQRTRVLSPRLVGLAL